MNSNCLIIGWFGYNNIGDELILHSLLPSLQEMYDKITVISANPRQTECIHNVRSISFDLSNLKYVRDADAIIFGGGQLFCDNRIRTIPLWTSIIKIIRLLNNGCAIYFLNQGFSARNIFLQKLLTSSLCSSELITVRDSDSFSLLKNLNISTPTFLGPDIVFSSEICEYKPALTRHKHPKKIIGVNLRPLFWWSPSITPHLIEQVLASTFDRILDQDNIKLVFLPFRLTGKERDSDIDIFYSILSKMKNKEEVELFICPLNEDLFKTLIDCYNTFDLFIGTALHSLIMSYKLRVPFLAFPYQKKCEIFLHDLGLQDFAIKQEDLNSVDSLYNRILDAMVKSEHIRHLLVETAPLISKESTNTHINHLLEIQNR